MKLTLQFFVEHFSRFRSDMAVNQVVILNLEFLFNSVYQVILRKLFQKGFVYDLFFSLYRVYCL
jgi:hypothetical protein